MYFIGLGCPAIKDDFKVEIGAFSFVLGRLVGANASEVEIECDGGMPASSSEELILDSKTLVDSFLLVFD